MLVGHIQQGQVVKEALGIDLTTQIRQREKALQLRGKREAAAPVEIVKGLDAELIARTEQEVPLPVMNDKREHPIQPLQHPLTFRLLH